MATDELRVQFVTAHERFRVTDTPFAVPAKLNHTGLSSVVCHLLGLDPPLPFDFLVAGHFVRTSLRKHLVAHGVSEVRGRVASHG